MLSLIYLFDITIAINYIVDGWVGNYSVEYVVF